MHIHGFTKECSVVQWRLHWVVQQKGDWKHFAMRIEEGKLFVENMMSPLRYSWTGLTVSGDHCVETQ